ncbi:EI24 domain-containing protein [Leifsonella bigeumensis]|uniref:EI24 domain-containing protein n=1 Tax=Leifsonella bigeumensis TaxID=433643 RepID=UPI0031DCE77E
MRASERGTGSVRRFFAGVGFLGRGLARWGTSPRLMLLGAIPALIVGAAFAAGIVLLAINLQELVVWSTPFAEPWVEPWRTLFRITVGAAFVGLAILIIVFSFTALTLAIGDPLYERIWRDVEVHAGGLPQGSPRSWTAVLADGARMLPRAIFGGLALFLLGFIPLIGQILVPVATALFAGWMLSIELTGRALEWRGFALRERRRMLAGNRAGALGFGLAAYLLFLLPLGAVIAMPAAVAGGTLLARSVLPEGSPR